MASDLKANTTSIPWKCFHNILLESNLHASYLNGICECYFGAASRILEISSDMSRNLFGPNLLSIPLGRFLEYFLRCGRLAASFRLLSRHARTSTKAYLLNPFYRWNFGLSVESMSKFVSCRLCAPSSCAKACMNTRRCPRLLPIPLESFSTLSLVHRASL